MNAKRTQAITEMLGELRAEIVRIGTTEPEAVEELWDAIETEGLDGALADMDPELEEQIIAAAVRSDPIALACVRDTLGLPPFSVA